MPNWVYNSVSVTGDAAEVKRLKDQVGAHYTMPQDTWDSVTKKHSTQDVECKEEFSFWNIVAPTGPDLKSYFDSIGASGASPFWYSWNNTHWGTKWDAGDVSMNVISDEHIQWSFQTAWGPPNEVLMELGKQFPTLTIQNEWEEEQGFGGTLDHTAGAFTILDEYDSPATHEEQMSRNGYCYCGEEDDPESFPFTDCPREDNPLGISVREIEEEASV